MIRQPVRRFHVGEVAKGMKAPNAGMCHPRALPGQPPSASSLPQMGPEKLQEARNLGHL